MVIHVQKQKEKNEAENWDIRNETEKKKPRTLLISTKTNCFNVQHWIL